MLSADDLVLAMTIPVLIIKVFAYNILYIFNPIYMYTYLLKFEAQFFFSDSIKPHFHLKLAHINDIALNIIYLSSSFIRYIAKLYWCCTMLLSQQPGGQS